MHTWQPPESTSQTDVIEVFHGSIRVPGRDVLHVSRIQPNRLTSQKPLARVAGPGPHRLRLCELGYGNVGWSLSNCAMHPARVSQ